MADPVTDKKKPDNKKANDEFEVKSIFTLEFGTTKEGHTELKLKGPEIANTHISPTIKLYKKNGKYAFEMGVEVYEIDANEMGEKFKAFFGEAQASAGPFGPIRIRMPDKWDLRRSDGTYMSFEDYERKVQALGTSERVGIGSLRFPKMAKPFYEALIRYYRISDLTRDGKYPLYL
jgi:hypothetical protein